MKFKLTALREANPDGTPGPFSFRRCAAAYLLALMPGLFALGLSRLAGLPEKVPAWVVLIPGALCLVGASYFMFRSA